MMSMQVTSTTSFIRFTEPSSFPLIRSRYCLYSNHGYLTVDEEYTHQPEHAHQLVCFEVACKQLRLLQHKHSELRVCEVIFQRQRDKWVSFCG